ncbi:alpha/beta hydrolase [Micromonospora sp. WMMA1923]|uniref:alpha/beta hydrolase n=1 Tax=Micromonospora TaxID=1873 RepID=UPI00227CFBB4|nr:alpha/beta hydrolase [Micromonospora yangpuensis]
MTSTRHSANVARQLGRHGVLATYDGWGHGVYTRGWQDPDTQGCMTTVIDTYLITTTPPTHDTHCPAIEPR